MSPLLETTFSYVYLFFLGASLGSFYKTLLERILYFFYSQHRKHFSKKERYYRLFFQPSFCYHCHQRIKRIYLLPVIGYWLSRGRCSHCKTPISKSYLVWEWGGGFLLMFFYKFFGVASFLLLFLVFQFLVIAQIDYQKFLIDFENLIILWVLSIVYLFLFDAWDSWEFWRFLFLKILLFVGTFLILFLITRGKKLGFGDVLLMIPISMIFDISEIIVIMFGASFLSILFILFYKKNQRSFAPLGSFLGYVSVMMLILKPLISFEELLAQI
ncbi:MAG: prepilin peptidase [Leptospiraceae bacterium]|nr:prepilin peptidase [Leptospiraceae bacterium]MDW7975047.1 prepilin peptidase [Leptospiraceae bacterium]